MTGRLGVTALCICAALAGCDREERDFGNTQSAVIASYDENDYKVSQVKRMFAYFNCSGCHANGGGGMGPPLMDDRWIYGSAPENIFATIVEGRPNGMPSFGGRIPTDRIWQIVAYVRSLSGLTPKGLGPSRDDHMQYSKPPARKQEEEKPRPANVPRPQ